MIFIIFGGGIVFARFLAMTGLSGWLANWIVGLPIGNLLLVCVISLLYIVLGCFMDSICMVTITVPLLNPIIAARGIDPIWYAMVIILAMHVGLLTPPVGLNVFAVKAVAGPKVRLEDIFLGSTPFFFATLVALGIIIAFPWLSIILPSLIFGG